MPGLRASARRFAARRLRILAFAGAGALAISAVAAVVPGGAAAQAFSYGQPVITVADGNSVIALQASDDSLLFYWNEFGTSNWHREVVAAAATTYSTPSIIQDGNSVVIAARGVGNSLDFYWQANGASSWHPVGGGRAADDLLRPVDRAGRQQRWSSRPRGPATACASTGPPTAVPTWTPEAVAGTGTTFSDPSLAVNGKSVNIAAEGPQQQPALLLGRQRQLHLEPRKSSRAPGRPCSAPDHGRPGRRRQHRGLGQRERLRIGLLLGAERQPRPGTPR